MYSRNYGRGDISSKIMPPPAYSGSAIQGKESPSCAKEEAKNTQSAFAPFSQSIPLPKTADDDEAKETHAECEIAEEKEALHKKDCDEAKKEKGSFLSSFLPGLSAEDLILIGIIIALAFDLADRDILLVALVIAAVIM
jgi:hypothetical protein